VGIPTLEEYQVVKDDILKIEPLEESHSIETRQETVLVEDKPAEIKYTDDFILMLKNRMEAGEKLNDLCNEFNVKYSIVYQRIKRHGKVKGRPDSNKKYSEELIQDIKARVDNGESLGSICKEMNLVYTSIHDRVYRPTRPEKKKKIL
jgi:hypothetical protein